MVTESIAAKMNELKTSFLTVSPRCCYRKCGHSSEELLKDLKDCDQYYTDGARDGCYLGVGHEIDICISAATVAESMSFKPLLGRFHL